MLAYMLQVEGDISSCMNCLEYALCKYGKNTLQETSGTLEGTFSIPTRASKN